MSEDNEKKASSSQREKYKPTSRYLDYKSIGAKFLEALERESLKDDQLDEDDTECCDDKGNFYQSANRSNLRDMEFSKLAIKTQDVMYPAREFGKVHSLRSIDEMSEDSEDKLYDVCHHGYRNGCTATIPSPEEISEEVFKENWLQKIEILRQREAAVIAKEANLRNRERQLFRREKEVRIAERAVKEERKQLEQQQQLLKNIERKLIEIEQIIGPQQSQESHKSQMHEPVKMGRSRNASLPSVVPSCEESIKKFDRRPTRNPTRSSFSSSSRPSSACKTSSGFQSYGSMRYKERPKTPHDDLNSTLSADAGDSSFVRTSEFFNAAKYKRPVAFTRSASDRWTKSQQNKVLGTIMQDMVDGVPEHVVEEDKVLQRLSENINATQDKNTKFQQYGLIDRLGSDDVTSKVEHNNDTRVAHLDLATGNKFRRRKPTADTSKSRPISWSEQTDKWLQQKRQAYSSSLQKTTEDKENRKCNIDAKKDNKTPKKNVKSKFFTIFR